MKSQFYFLGKIKIFQNIICRNFYPACKVLIIKLSDGEKVKILALRSCFPNTDSSITNMYKKDLKYIKRTL